MGSVYCVAHHATRINTVRGVYRSRDVWHALLAAQYAGDQPQKRLGYCVVRSRLFGNDRARPAQGENAALYLLHHIARSLPSLLRVQPYSDAAPPAQDGS